jgi:hypothetical protein
MTYRMMYKSTQSFWHETEPGLQSLEGQVKDEIINIYLNIQKIR